MIKIQDTNKRQNGVKILKESLKTYLQHWLKEWTFLDLIFPCVGINGGGVNEKTSCSPVLSKSEK